MDNQYQQDLRLLKGTFDPGNEASVIATAIAGGNAKSPLRLLDVGIGEGRAILQATRRLEALGYKILLTGLDLRISTELRDRMPSSSVLVEDDFFQYFCREHFDAVVSTQSLYYFGDTQAALRKLIAHSAPSGCLVVTVWTSRCVLRDLHLHFVSTPGTDCLAAENVADDLRRLDPGATVDLVRTAGRVNLKQWLTSEATCMAAFRILSRAAPKSSFDETRYRAFRKHLAGLPDEMNRENGTVVLRRSGDEVDNETPIAS